jgi:hypothetical protein
MDLIERYGTDGSSVPKALTDYVPAPPRSGLRREPRRTRRAARARARARRARARSRPRRDDRPAGHSRADAAPRQSQERRRSGPESILAVRLRRPVLPPSLSGHTVVGQRVAVKGPVSERLPIGRGVEVAPAPRGTELQGIARHGQAETSACPIGTKYTGGSARGRARRGRRARCTRRSGKSDDSREASPTSAVRSRPENSRLA